MVSSTVSVASLLSEVYQNNQASLNSSLTKLASGKRVQNASDDFAAYIKNAANTSYISQYQSFNRDLASANAGAQYALAVGNQVMTYLTEMKNNRTEEAGTTDANQIAALNSAFTSMQTQMNDYIAQSNYEGTAVYVAAGSTISNTSAVIGGATYNVAVKTTKGAANGVLADTAASLQTKMNDAATFISDINAAIERIGAQTSLNNSTIASYQAANSALVDVDDAAEQANITAMQVRQTATASMMAQANSSAGAIARIYQ